MAPFQLPASFGLLLVIFGVAALVTLYVFRPQFNGDFIDEHVGRGSIEDDWGLDSLDDAARS